MSNYIIFNDPKSKNQCGIKPIDNSIFNKLVYNQIHNKNKFSISKLKLEEEFETKLNSEKETINVILMNEINEFQLETYLETFEDEKDNLNDYNELLSIITFNQINPEKFKIKKKLDSILESVSSYWEDSSNCKCNLNQQFSQRRFNNNDFSGNIDNINNVVLTSSNTNLDLNSREVNYLSDIIRDNKYTDMLNKKYYISKVSELSNEDFLNIYKQIPTDYLKYMFITNLLCSRTHCHLILNNLQMLKLLKPMFDTYKLVFKYLIGYSWITLKNEEYHSFLKIKDTSRIIFDIDTASELPVFPFTYEDINQNPYAGLLIDNELLELNKNCVSLNMMRNYEKYYGVCNREEFSRRLNIFINGVNKKGILDYIDWSCCAISGSAMTACGMKYNPLIDICKQDNNFNQITDADLTSFFFHYYADSDIDLICNKLSIYDFIDVVDQFVQKSIQHCGKTTIDNVHTATIILSDEFIEKELVEIKNKLNLKQIDLEYVKLNFSSQDIKNYFYDKYYVEWKKEQTKVVITLGKQNNKLYQEYLNLVPREEFRLYTLDYSVDSDSHIKKDYEKYFYSDNINNSDSLSNLDESTNFNNTNQTKLIAKLSESIRYKVKPFGTKTFEIFKSRNENFFSMVSRFHMGFVRAIWNGSTLKCLPSYITSMMLQLAVDYKYFASIRDPIEIVNKYRSRGFGIILNDYEKLHMAYYNSVKNTKSDCNHKWIQMYNVNIKNKNSIASIFGPKKSSEDIFKPSKYFMGLPQDCYKNVNHDTVSTFDSCFNSIITPKLVSIAKYKAINSNGNINPLAREVILMGWNLINNTTNDNLKNNYLDLVDKINDINNQITNNWDNSTNEWANSANGWDNPTDGWGENVNVNVNVINDSSSW